MDKGIIIFSLILILLVVAYNFGFLKQPKIVNGNVLPGNIFVDGRFYNFRNNMKIPEIFEINGSAKGNWFFEASLPITIEDEQGNVLETFTAQAQEDWMTKDYVEFNGEAVAYRGLFLIDKQGIVRHQVVNDLPLGRSVEEAIRMVDALQFFEEHGEVCPAGWNKGKPGMVASTEGVAAYLAKNAKKL